MPSFSVTPPLASFPLPPATSEAAIAVDEAIERARVERARVKALTLSELLDEVGEILDR